MMHTEWDTLTVTRTLALYGIRRPRIRRFLARFF